MWSASYIAVEQKEKFKIILGKLRGIHEVYNTRHSSKCWGLGASTVHSHWNPNLQTYTLYPPTTTNTFSYVLFSFLNVDNYMHMYMYRG